MFFIAETTFFCAFSESISSDKRANISAGEYFLLNSMFFIHQQNSEVYTALHSINAHAISLSAPNEAISNPKSVIWFFTLTFASAKNAFKGAIIIVPKVLSFQKLSFLDK